MGVINVTEKEVKKIVKGFNLVPSFNRMIVTLNRQEDQDGVITSEDNLADIQYVIAAGEKAWYKAGDKIMLDLQRLTVKERSQTDATQTVDRIRINPFMYDSRVFTIISDNDVIGKFKVKRATKTTK